MEMKKEVTETLPHNIMLEQRSRLVMSGVTEVVSFEEDKVSLATTLGHLTVNGEGLKMETYRAEVGDLVINGNVYAFIYTDDTPKKEGFFSRILK